MKVETYEELRIKELEAELAAYRWRDKKATILKELGLTTCFSTYNRDEIINAYEANRPFALIKALNLIINNKVDDLIIKGYAMDEIIRAVRDWVQERLDEIENEKENIV